MDTPTNTHLHTAILLRISGRRVLRPAQETIAVIDNPAGKTLTGR